MPSRVAFSVTSAAEPATIIGGTQIAALCAVTRNTSDRVRLRVSLPDEAAGVEDVKHLLLATTEYALARLRSRLLGVCFGTLTIGSISLIISAVTTRTAHTSAAVLRGKPDSDVGRSGARVIGDACTG